MSVAPDSGLPTPDQSTLTVNGAQVIADLSGALYWPARGLLIVADLHLEKGSSYAPSGQLLPPYDTTATLERLAAVCRRYAPSRVLCLGDSFHDGEASARLAADDRARIEALTATHDWLWLCGNHDPAPPADWGGQVEEELVEGPLVFRHEAQSDRPVAGEISGHFHPKASVKVRFRRLTARCFVTDGRRLILPAFGAYTGGLNVLEPAIASLFPAGFQVTLLGKRQSFVYPRRALVF